MATQKRKSDAPEAAPTKAGRPNRRGASLHVWIDPVIRKTLEDVVKQSEPTTTATAIVELALRRYFETLGAWPPRGK